MAKKITITLDIEGGTLTQEGALFLGGEASIEYEGYEQGRNPILALFQRRRDGLWPVSIATVPEGGTMPLLNLNTVASRESFAWCQKEHPDATIALQAYAIDGESLEAVTVEQVTRIVAEGSRWIVAHGIVQVKWSPVNFEADGTMVSLKGDPGPVGPQGERGEKGEQGERGERGEQGERGERGERGLQGVQGIRGLQGERGEKGEQGERGEKGEQGERGIQGERGLQGERGMSGPEGRQGIPGATGANGVDGKNGLSTYEIAVKNGYTGTEEQWIGENSGLNDCLSEIADAYEEQTEFFTPIVAALEGV